MSRTRLVLLFFALAYLVYIFFFDLGKTKLTNWDEAWYADIARTIAETGNILDLISNQNPYMDHPPLFFATTAVWFKLFGVAEFWARFSAALSGFFLVLITCDLGRRLFSWPVGLIAAAILASSMQFLYRARTGNLDAMFMLFIALSFYCYARFRLEKQDKWLGVMWLALLLTFLTKSFVGFLPLSLLGLFWIFADRLQVLKSKYFWLGALATILAIGSWYLYMVGNLGDVFVKQHFKIIGLQRLTQAAAPSHLTIWWFLPILKSGLKIWSVVLPFALVFAFIEGMSGFGKKGKDWRLILLVFWFLVFFVPFSLAANKDGWHILPVYPAISLVMAVFLVWLWVKFIKTKLELLVVLALIAALLQNFYFQQLYIVPETTLIEAKVAEQLSQLTRPADVVVFDDHAYPVTLFYGRRQLDWIRVPGASESESNKKLKEIILGGRKRFIVTKPEYVAATGVNQQSYQTVYQYADKIIIYNEPQQKQR
ncbi:glycosyltransferase family 39 protein [Candidatus Daviesbacteria bacterium]|nr:glycosyltransferase family 39 protein [Candidatus Daviesbacteria bacterium]